MEAIIAYTRNGSVYYDYGNRHSCLVARGELVSVSGNYIVYKQGNSIYKAEVNSNGYICRSNIYVGRA